jgi:hypothetical protein
LSLVIKEKYDQVRRLINMGKERGYLSVLCAVIGLFPSPGRAQRMDVDMEGPWVFYLDSGFPDQSGSLKSVLVAIAPKVRGHYYPTFSAGTGGNVRSVGIYCVGFGAGTSLPACTPNNLNTWAWSTYMKPAPEIVKKPASFDWRTLASKAYIFIFPVPDSISSDGLYMATLQSTFPTGTTASTTTESGPRSIGIQLHYVNGPGSVALLPCTGAPSAGNCAGAPSLAQQNSGTVRLHIKSIENPMAEDACEHHVHRAYHKMLMLVDPQLSVNQSRAYINEDTYDSSCSPCDPQQDLIPSDCNTMDPATLTTADVPEELSRVVALMEGLNLSPKQAEQLQLPALKTQSENVSGRFPGQNELMSLKKTLLKSEEGIHDLLEVTSDSIAGKQPARGAALPSVTLRVGLESAESQEEALTRLADVDMMLAISGKDCRAVIMLVQ